MPVPEEQIPLLGGAGPMFRGTCSISSAVPAMLTGDMGRPSNPLPRVEVGDCSTAAVQQHPWKKHRQQMRM